MATITSLPVASTIDAVADTFPIVTNSINTTQQISRNTFLSLSSAPVGLTDAQTLTSKTLTNPTINSATLSGTISGTYTLGGTPTFPSTVVTTTGTQTLTSKTLTSPTINSPTITNATISADTLTGYTTSNTGTVYGIPITTGVINTAGTINGASLVANSITNASILTGNLYTSKVYNPYKFSVYRTAAYSLSVAQAAVPFDTKLFDTGTNIDVVTNKGRFTAPVAGFYCFSAGITVAATTGDHVYMDLFKNGGVVIRLAEANAAATTNQFYGGSVTLQLAANDYIEVYVADSTIRALTVSAPQYPYNYFSGFLVSVT